MLIEKKLQSFQYAITGLRVAWSEEFNFRFEVVCAVVALGLAWALHLSREEIITVIFVIGFVLAAEALNTALEEFCDMVKSDPDPHIAKIKDLAAAAVLISSVAAFVIGCLIFIPHLLLLL